MKSPLVVLLAVLAIGAVSGQGPCSQPGVVAQIRNILATLQANAGQGLPKGLQEVGKLFNAADAAGQSDLQIAFQAICNDAASVPNSVNSCANPGPAFPGTSSCPPGSIAQSTTTCAEVNNIYAGCVCSNNKGCLTTAPSNEGACLTGITAC